jgi:hypothetical protein
MCPYILTVACSLTLSTPSSPSSSKVVSWIQQIGYQGHIYFDTFPHNEDPVREAAHNIRVFKRLWARALSLRAQGMGAMLDSHDAMGAAELQEQVSVGF